MNKLLSFLMCLLFAGSSAAWAWTSDDDYVPFVREGSEWGYRYHNYDGEPASFDNDIDKNYIYYIHGDTTLNGISYKKFYVIAKEYNHHADENNQETIINKCFIALREDNKIVYGVALDTIGTRTCSDLYMDNRMHGVYYDLNQEGILYDFSNVHDFLINKCIALYGGNEDSYYIKVEELENSCVQVSGRTMSYINNHGEHWLIEGIGMIVYRRWGDIINWGFSTRACYPQEGGELMYMRNGDGVYEYLAEGLEMSEVETVRNSFNKVVARVCERQLSVDLPPTAEPSVVEVFSADGRSVARKVASGENVTLSLAHLPVGVYVVTVRNARFSHNTKIILK